MPREDATGPTSRLQPRLWPLLPHIGWKMRPQPSQKGLAVKNPPANLGETQGSTPGSGRSPGGGNGNPFQFSCLETPMDSGAWWATAHGSAKSRTWLSHKGGHMSSSFSTTWDGGKAKKFRATDSEAWLGNFKSTKSYHGQNLVQPLPVSIEQE